MNFVARTVTVVPNEDGIYFAREADGSVVPLNREGYKTQRGAVSALRRFYVAEAVAPVNHWTLTGPANPDGEISSRDEAFVSRMISHDIEQDKKREAAEWEALRAKRGTFGLRGVRVFRDGTERVGALAAETYGSADEADAARRLINVRDRADGSHTEFRVELIEEAATELPADAPVLYFEQDGAYFSYRDRPFYFVDFDYVGSDGMSAGVCPSFHCEAPFPVTDFDMAGAERAAEWFAQEAARAGYRAERAPDYYATTAPVPCHPDEELADLRTVRADGESGGFMTVAEFVAYRAAPQEPVCETFDSFETWRPAYLAILEDCWFEAELRDKDLLEEEYYTAGLTPVEAANRFFKCL